MPAFRWGNDTTREALKSTNVVQINSALRPRVSEYELYCGEMGQPTKVNKRRAFPPNQHAFSPPNNIHGKFVVGW